MTIVVGVAAPDGLILAADSRTTRVRGDHHRISTDTAHKVFSVCDRFAIATYGNAFIGTNTIAGEMDEFVAKLVGAAVPDHVDEMAHAVGDFFQERLVATGADPAGGPTLGFLVGGYDASGVGHFMEVRVPDASGPQVISLGVTTDTLGVLPRGQTEVVTRLIAGVDWDQLAVNAQEKKVTVPDDVVAALEDLEYDLIYPITLQDAIDCAHFLIRTTVDMQRFHDGTLARAGSIPGCGGATRIVAVTPSGVTWVHEGKLIVPTRAGLAEGALGSA